jgi:hypothetical protein
MAVYTLINGATQVFATFTTIIPYQTDNPIPQPTIGNVQGFQLVVKGNNGQNVSATVQIATSNDGVTWSNYVDALTAMGVTTGNATWNATGNYKFFSAILTAISGTGAKATLTMSA